MKKLGYVCLVSIIIALVLLIVGSTMNGFGELQNLYNKGEFTVLSKDYKSYNINREYENIQSIKLNSNANQVHIIEYDGTTIKVEATDVTNTSITNNNQTLIIKNDDYHVIGIGNYKGKINIYVPRDYSFNNLEIELDAGSCTFDNLKAQNINIDVDAGEVTGNNINSSYINIDVDAGKVNVGLLDCAKSNFDCDAGSINVKMVGSESDYSYDVEYDAGSVTVGNYHSDGLSDDYSYQGGSRSIEAHCDAGKIMIEMEGL